MQALTPWATKTFCVKGLFRGQLILVGKGTSQEEKQIVHDIFAAEGLAAMGYGDLIPILRESGVEDRGIQRADELFAEVQGRYRWRQDFVQSTTRARVGSVVKVAATRVAFTKPNSVIGLGLIERELEALRAEIGGARAEAASLRETRAKLEAEAKERSVAYEALQVELEDAKVEAKSLRETRAKLEAEAKERSVAYEALQVELQDSKVEAKSLREMRDKHETELSAIRQRMAQLTDERDELSQAVPRQASEISRLDLTIAGLPRNIAALEQTEKLNRSEAERTCVELDAMRQALASLDFERQALNDLVGRLETTMAAMRLEFVLASARPR